MASVAELAPYEYKELPNRPGKVHIRLLRLQPALTPQDPIFCHLIRVELVSDGKVLRIVSIDNKDESINGYEAVSWCWGEGELDSPVTIQRGNEIFTFKVTANLIAALASLRKKLAQYLWVDAICIDQKNLHERNIQVPMMNKIYGHATKVCVWIGDADDTSDLAITFIKEKLLNMWTFDGNSRDPKTAEEVKAFWRLLQRPWFSRRWVIQEIASAKRAVLYCGAKSVDWNEFAVAVSLFVDAESSAHPFSAMLKQDRSSDDTHEVFSYASELGAAILIDATSNLFRSSRDGYKEPLLSLEYLVSRYTIFDATQPRDTIYALLAIARDTTPKEELFSSDDVDPGDRKRTMPPQALFALRALAKRQFRSQAYRVDYNLPVDEVYKDFIEFAIQQSEQTRALDIICRPWARRPTVRQEKGGFHFGLNGSLAFGPSDNRKRHSRQESGGGNDDEYMPLPSWIATLDEMPLVLNPTSGSPAALFKMQRASADPLVGLPLSGQRNYNATGSIKMSPLPAGRSRFVKRKNIHMMLVEGFILDQISEAEPYSQLGSILGSWLKTGGWHNWDKPGKGLPPDALWRTLVANRGPDNKNPPSYYPRACKEAVTKFMRSGILDTANIIARGGSSIVAKFLQRVQAAIWGRCLIKTAANRIGLAPKAAQVNDFICIFYGCSVPVVLRRFEKRVESFDIHPQSQNLPHRDPTEAELNAAEIIVKVRVDQLQRRALQPAWRLKRRMGNWLITIRAIWLMAALMYYLWIRDSFTEPALGLFLLITTSPAETRSTVLAFIPTSLRGKQLHVPLFGHERVKRAMFSILICVQLASWRCGPSVPWYPAVMAFVFFPRLFLVPIGLEGIVTLVQIEKKLNQFGAFFRSQSLLGSFLWIRKRLKMLLATVLLMLALLTLIYHQNLDQNISIILLGIGWSALPWVVTTISMTLPILGTIPSIYFVWRWSRPFAEWRRARTSIVTEESAVTKQYYWEVVGACYLHGMMDGEAIEWQSSIFTRVAEAKARIRDEDKTSKKKGSIGPALAREQSFAKRQLFELR